MELNYNSAREEEQDFEGKRIFVKDFFISGNLLPNWNVTGMFSNSFNGRHLDRYTLTRGKSEEEVITVDIVENSSWRQAHKTLQGFLSEALVSDFRDGKRAGFNAGDIGFASPGKIPHVFLFARGNMLLRVSSIGKTPVDITGSVYELDSLFTGDLEVMKLNNMETVETKIKTRINEKVEIPSQVVSGGRQWSRYTSTAGEIYSEGGTTFYTAEAPQLSEIQVLTSIENLFFRESKILVEAA